MYPSAEQRDADIEEAAALSPPELRQDVLGGVERLAAAVRDFPADKWPVQVRTFSGRTVPASEIPWMRCREVWVHAVDLDAGVDFTEVPGDVLAALLDDVFAMWRRGDVTPPVTVFAGDRTWGDGAVAVSGPLPAVTGWLTGRSRGEELTADGDLPALPRWI